jgi:hypothetical protein
VTSMSYRHNDVSSEMIIKNLNHQKEKPVQGVVGRGILRGSHSGHFLTTFNNLGSASSGRQRNPTHRTGVRVGANRRRKLVLTPVNRSYRATTSA